MTIDYSNTHVHHHEHGTPEDTDETMAMLAYLLDHHRHHTAEIAELATSLDEETRTCVSDAVRCYAIGDEKLAEAIRGRD